MLADAQGPPVQVVLGPGQQHDCTRAVELLSTVPRTRKVLADKAYATNQVLAAVAVLDAEAVIPCQPRRELRVIDRVACQQRNRIARLMSHAVKQFRRLATRYDKTASSYLGFVNFICALLRVR